MAIARVSCASREIEPIDIAPVQKRLVISSTGSTSSMEIDLAFLKLNNPRKVHWRVFSLSACWENFLYVA